MEYQIHLVNGCDTTISTFGRLGVQFRSPVRIRCFPTCTAHNKALDGGDADVPDLSPDVVVMDCTNTRPDCCDGRYFQACCTGGRDTPLVVLSDAGRLESVPDTVRESATLIIEKPLPADLSATLEQLAIDSAFGCFAQTAFCR